MAGRVAFLIGNQTFRPSSDLPPLEGPANDVAALARLLRDPERGQFEVHEFLDKTHYEVLPEVEQSLGRAAEGDFFLIYYSGHGKLAKNGELCLATADTFSDALRATSIPSRHLRDLVEESNSTQVLLLLDCCYSGAVGDGLRGDIGSELQVVQNARGFYIITATTRMQTAREIAPVPGGVVMGRFTASLVNGIESGAADHGRKGKILLSDLRRYLGDASIGSTPQFFDRNASGDPLISHSPATVAPLLDAGVLADLDAEQWYRRRVQCQRYLAFFGTVTRRPELRRRQRCRVGWNKSATTAYGPHLCRRWVLSLLVHQPRSIRRPYPPGRAPLPIQSWQLLQLTSSCRKSLLNSVRPRGRTLRCHRRDRHPKGARLPWRSLTNW